MPNPVELSIAFDAPTFTPGSTVSGVVRVTTTTAASMISVVQMRCVGEVVTAAARYQHTQGGRSRHLVTFREKQTILDASALLYSAAASASPSQPGSTAAYTFRVKLPSTIPPSFDETSNQHALRYFVAATATLAEGPPVEARVLFKVVPCATRAAIETQPPCMPVQASKKFLFGGAGLLTVSCSLSRQHLFPNESIEVIIDLDNQSRKSIEGFRVILYEKLHWRARGHVETLVAPLRQCQYTNATMDGAFRDLSRSSRQFRLPFVLPPWSVPTFRTPTVTLTRYFVVTTIVPWAVDLEVDIPVSSHIEYVPNMFAADALPITVITPPKGGMQLVVLDAMAACAAPVATEVEEEDVVVDERQAGSGVINGNGQQEEPENKAAERIQSFYRGFRDRRTVEMAMQQQTQATSNP
jgi:hypothetical protein